MKVSILDACERFDDELIHYMLSKKVHIVSSLCSHCWNIVISNHLYCHVASLWILVKTTQQLGIKGSG